MTIDDILTLVERLRATPADAPATALANIPAAAAPIAPKAQGMTAAPGEQPMTDDTIFACAAARGSKCSSATSGPNMG